VGTQDEATFGLIPLIMRGWARRGSHPFVKINHKNVCTNVFGARSKKSFVYFFRKKKRQKQFIEFLELLRKRWREYLLFVDGAKAHGGKKVQAYLEKHKKSIKLEYFPKCSPEMNPTEQCWKPGRNALANRVLPSLNAAKYHLQKTFDDQKTMPKMFKYLRD
jgi:hypothetical protein